MEALENSCSRDWKAEERKVHRLGCRNTILPTVVGDSEDLSEDPDSLQAVVRSLRACILVSATESLHKC